MFEEAFVEGLGKLGIDTDGVGPRMVADVEAAEGGFAAVEVQAAFGSGFGNDGEDLFVGVLLAEFDDALVVFGREGVKDGFRLHNGASLFVKLREKVAFELLEVSSGAGRRARAGGAGFGSD